MSPMDERELRHELRHAAPDLPASDTLGRAVMARGRALRRRRGEDQRDNRHRLRQGGRRDCQAGV